MGIYPVIYVGCAKWWPQRKVKDHFPGLQKNHLHPPRLSLSATESKPMERKRKHTSMLETPSPKLERFLAECAAAPCISVNLCDLNASAGVALRHAIRTLEHLFQKQEPLIFKIGFTHSPVWRWSNNIYGYCKDKANWSNMIVFYCAEEPHGPAMMEAALIEKYGSTFAIYGTLLFIPNTKKSGSNISFFWIEQKNKLRQTRM